MNTLQRTSKQWGIWTSNILLILGLTLILAGIMFFFAFNWAIITPMIKFIAIQAIIVVCLIGAYIYSLNTLGGKSFLFTASVMIGIFMAAFGQIYQTGADSYQLFMMWSIFIIGWTIISNLSAQWILWLVVTNIALGLWWGQAALPTKENDYLIYIYFTLLNGAALLLREYFATKPNYDWLKAQWLRIFLLIIVLLSMTIPITTLILFPEYAVTKSVLSSGIFGIAGHAVIYILYRFLVKDIVSLSIIVMFICKIIWEWGFAKLQDQYWRSLFDIETILFISASVMTFAIITVAVIYLRYENRILSEPSNV